MVAITGAPTIATSSCSCLLSRWQWIKSQWYSFKTDRQCCSLCSLGPNPPSSTVGAARQTQHVLDYLKQPREKSSKDSRAKLHGVRWQFVRPHRAASSSGSAQLEASHHSRHRTAPIERDAYESKQPSHQKPLRCSDKYGVAPETVLPSLRQANSSL